MTHDSGPLPSPPPAVLCMAAGISQLVIIKKARELGFAVIGVDQNMQAPAFSHCDERIVASTYHSKPILEQLLPLCQSYEIVGVLNRSSGYPVIAAAEICQELGLPGPPPAAATTLTNKSLLLEACNTSGIAVPHFQAAASLADLDRTRVEFPCVVKPALSLVGKSGIQVVTDPASLAEAFAAALSLSLNGWVNVEELVPGRDLSLLAVIEAGEILPVVLRDELNSVLPSGGIGFNGIAVPSLFSGQVEETRVLSLARQVADTFHLDRTVINLSCRCEKGGHPKLIEVHLDIGGDLFFEGLLPECTEVDILGALLGILTGTRNKLPDFATKPAALLFGSKAEQANDRPYSVVKAETRDELSEKISAGIGYF